VCCFLLALFAFGPRLVLGLEWIFGHRIRAAFAYSGRQAQKMWGQRNVAY
jgi:hypothetical protein